MNTSNARVAVRDSNIPGFGEIPAHWRVVALKHLVGVPITDGPHETPEFVDSGIPFVSAEAVWNGRVHIEDVRGFISREAHDLYSKKYRPAKNDIYVVKSGATTGKVAIVDIEDEFGIWSPLAAIRCDQEQALPRFVFHSLVSDYFQGQVQISWSLGTQPNIGMEVLENLYVFLPPLPEQRAIADYLDRETARLDGLVTAKERVLGLLAEKRRALITRAVTRGLNPRVPLRDSGISWLGDIPTHWELVPLRFLVEFSGGATPDTGKAELWDGDIPWVSPKDMKREEIQDAEDHVSALALSSSALRMIDAVAVLIVVRGMILAHSFPTAVTTRPVTINQDMKALRSRESLEPRFLRDFLRGFEPHLVSIAEESAHGTRKLESGVLGRFEVCVPPLEEQRAIVACIATATAKLDALRTATERTIGLLKERRAALIASAVTGKLRLPNDEGLCTSHA